MKIKVSSGSSDLSSLLLRQTPKSSGEWKGNQFYVNQHVDNCDWWFILHAGSLRKTEIAICDPSHVVFISMEPPDWGCPNHFYSQFSHLVSCDPRSTHQRRISANGITWWAGIKVKFEDGHSFSARFDHDYDSFSSLPLPPKKDKISVITSANRAFPGHRKRLAFLERLRSHPISKFIDFFGGHSNPVEDKLDALIGYKYHLSLENSVASDYWTEKFSDPLLAWSLPIYHGCPNIQKYFPPDSCIPVDIDNFDATVEVIHSAILENKYTSCLPGISSARKLVLNEYNIFQLMASIADAPASSYEKCLIKPLDYYRKADQRIDRRIKRKAGFIIEQLLGWQHQI